MRSQPLEVLGWALGGTGWTKRWGVVTTFAYDKLKPERLLGGTLPDFLLRPRLRARKELAERRDFEEAWAWRVRMAGLPLTIAMANNEEMPDWTGVNEDPLEKERDAIFAKAVARRAADGRERGWFTPVAGDFPIQRRAFGTVFDSDYSPMSFEQFANEGLRAANWLMRSGERWQSATVATPFGFVLPARFVDDRRFLKYYLDPRGDGRWYY